MMRKFLLAFIILTIFGCVNSPNLGRAYRFFKNKNTSYLNIKCHYWYSNNTFYLVSIGSTTFHSITCRKVKETDEFISFTPIDELRIVYSKKRKNHNLNQLNLYSEGKTVHTDCSLTFEYNDTKYSLNDFPILEAKKCDSLSIEVGLNNKKIPVTFSYINFDYSDLDIKTEISIDSVVMDIQKKEIYFFLNGKEFLSINKLRNWTFE